MSSPQPSNVTRLLTEWSSGNPGALEQLLPLIYDELRRLASRYLNHERPGHTLQATALVHEAYLKLVGISPDNHINRLQFFGLCAQVMRRILIDYARRHKAGIRGGGVHPLSLDEALVYAPERSADLVDLDEALQGLSAVDERKSKVVELRFFAGLTVDETAEILGVSPNTVFNDWTFARAWLQREMQDHKNG